MKEEDQKIEELIKSEIERIESLLGFHYFIQDRIYKETKEGYINKKDALIVLRRNHNIPLNECPIIFKGMEILGLIECDGEYYKVKEPKKSKEELVLKFKKKMKLV